MISPRPLLPPRKRARAALSPACVVAGAISAAVSLAPRVVLRWACERGRVLACLTLPELDRQRHVVDAASFQRAAAAYARACEAGEPEGCARLGWHYERGLGVPRDVVRAAELYRTACDAGTDCYLWASMLESGSGVDRDAKRAAELFEHGCARSELGACAALAWTLIAANTDEALGRAFALSSKACEGGYYNACSTLGWMYEEGHGVVRDSARAVALYRQVCDSGELAGCVSLGRMYERVEGVPEDPYPRTSLYVQPLESLGIKILKESNDTRAAALYERACDAGEMIGCTALARMCWRWNGIGEDIPRGRALLTRACLGGDVYGCEALANVYIGGKHSQEDEALALAFAERACRERDPDACGVVAKIHLSRGRDGTAGETELGADILRRQCAQGDPLACYDLRLHGLVSSEGSE